MTGVTQAFATFRPSWNLNYFIDIKEIIELSESPHFTGTVLEIDKESQRISLGVKQLETDPWEEIGSRFNVGDMVKGTVAKIAAFGAFIQLEDEVDGLVHISQLSEEHVTKVKEVVNIGDEVEARVIKVDKAERRIGLSIKAASYSEEDLKNFLPDPKIGDGRRQIFWRFKIIVKNVASDVWIAVKKHINTSQ